MAWRRQERGFGCDAWSTHSRLIISHALLRRPEYRDPPLAHLGERARKGLLVVDEAHIAAPACGGRARWGVGGVRMQVLSITRGSLRASSTGAELLPLFGESRGS